jgi:SAM-dependent methyltransferase
MAHPQQFRFCFKIKELYPEFFINKKVLDVGSLDINGSNKDFFTDCEYIGVDLGEGPNVDLVCSGHELKFEDEYFDTIISTETFEHDMHYVETIQNIIRMLKSGGMFLFTCATTGRPEHGTMNAHPYDAPLLNNIEEWCNYYKNLTKEDFMDIPVFSDAFTIGLFEYEAETCDIYFCGIKK